MLTYQKTDEESNFKDINVPADSPGSMFLPEWVCH